MALYAEARASATSSGKSPSVGAVGTIVLALAGGIGILKLAAYWTGVPFNLSQGD